jgi:hypothetical protein
MVGPIVDQTNYRRRSGVESTQIEYVATTPSTNLHQQGTSPVRRSSDHRSSTPEQQDQNRPVSQRGEHTPSQVEWSRLGKHRRKRVLQHPLLCAANHLPLMSAYIESHHRDFGIRAHIEQRYR